MVVIVEFVEQFYHNPDYTLYTNDIEVMKYVDKFDIITYSDNNNDGDLSKIKDVYIHYIRACIVITRFIISKEYKIPFEKLDENKVVEHTKQMWKKEFKNIEDKFFEKNKNFSLSKILAIRLLLNIQLINQYVLKKCLTPMRKTRQLSLSDLA